MLSLALTYTQYLQDTGGYWNGRANLWQHPSSPPVMLHLDGSLRSAVFVLCILRLHVPLHSMTLSHCTLSIIQYCTWSRTCNDPESRAISIFCGKFRGPALSYLIKPQVGKQKLQQRMRGWGRSPFGAMVLILIESTDFWSGLADLLHLSHRSTKRTPALHAQD